jgi:hypothetical protein
VASDDAAVRALAAATFGDGGARPVLHADQAPAQTAFTSEDDDDAAADAVALFSWGEWARLAACPALITSIYSGYGRSAGGAGWGSALYFYDDDVAGAADGPCVPRVGPSRDFAKGFGAGW